MRTRVLVGVILSAAATPLLAVGIRWIYVGVTFYQVFAELAGIFAFLFPGLILLSIGIPLIVTKHYPTPKSRMEQAQKDVAKGRHSKAGRHFRKAAQFYEKMGELEAAETSYRKAAESYHASKNFGLLCYFLKKRVMRAKIDPGAKIEILKESANQLLQAGEPKKAAGLVKKMRSLYKKAPLQDVEKATYYEKLAKQVKAGGIDAID